MKSPAQMRREAAARPPAIVKPEPKKFGGLVIEQRALPVLQRSPSWPPMGHDMDLKLRTVPQSKACKKAAMYIALILLNDLVVFLSARILWVTYMDMDTEVAFSDGLSVKGHLAADSMEVTVDGPQAAMFQSTGQGCGLSVYAGGGAVSKLVLGKTSSPDWVLANEVPRDQFELSKGEQSFLTVDPTTATSKFETHVDAGAGTLFGGPLVLSTGAPIPVGRACSQHDSCGAGFCNVSNGTCAHGVPASDVLLSPQRGGSIRVASDVKPVRGDMVLIPEHRIVVRKQTGTVGGGLGPGAAAAQMLLESTHLMMLNPFGASCMSACLGSGSGGCPAGVSSPSHCPGLNVLSTLTEAEGAASQYGGQGSLSISDVVFVHPPRNGSRPAGTMDDISVSLAGSLDVAHHPLLGSPLLLSARGYVPPQCPGGNCTGTNYSSSGTNITVEAVNGGTIAFKSPTKMAGPILPKQLVGRLGGTVDGAVPMVYTEGTLKVQNLQFQILDEDKNRPNGSPQPTASCDFESKGRHGWLRMTSDQAQRQYLYFCTENGWKPIFNSVASG
jgi:hypothetical protein